MKRTLKLISLVLTVAIIFTLGAVGCSGGKGIEETVTYKPLPGNLNTYLIQNPDRGYRGEWYTVFKASRENASEKDTWSTIYLDDGYEANTKKIDQIYDLYTKDGLLNTTKLFLWQVNMTIGLNNLDELPKELFDLYDYMFDICRRDKIKLLARFSYGAGVYTTNATQEGKEYLARVCADEEHMIMHTKQLGEFLKGNSDAIHKITSGFIGNGEMVYEFQWPEVNYNNVIKAVVENICVPNDLYFSVRVPKYKLGLVNAEPDYQYLNLIGHNNDGVFGESERYEHGGGCNQINHNFDITGPGQCQEYDLGGTHENNTWYEYVCETAAYTPQSGEMYTIDGLEGRWPTGLAVILQMAHQRYTTLSHWHTMYENFGRYHTMQSWIDNELITEEILDEHGIIYDPSWFYDENGDPMERNPYEFLRDHLGYKIEAQSATFKGTLGKGKSLNVNMSFKNYGFAAPFCLTSGFAILNDDYEVVSNVDVGDPDSWISLPVDYYTTERNTSVQNDIISYNLEADLTLPKESGKYYIGFYLKNTMDDFACLSNDEGFENGYNILYEFEI